MLGAIQDRPPEGIETAEMFKVEIVPYCRKSDRLADLETVHASDISGRRWITRRDETVVARMATYFSDRCLPAPDIAIEVEALAAGFRIVANSDKLTLAPLSLTNVASEFGLVPLRLSPPIWSFGSGAWFRASSREYPIMRRALDIVPQLVNETMAIPPSYGPVATKSFPLVR
jgi:DNA-binding transcriptional LysR family regulator